MEDEIFETQTDTSIQQDIDDQSGESSIEIEKETETDAVEEAIEDTPDSYGENINEELTDRLDALIEILTPAESVENETENSSSADAGAGNDETISSADAYDQELLQNIYETLILIKSGNVSYHAEMLVLQEEMSAHQKHISESIECSLFLLLAIGFFVSLSCGCKFADTFFKRMRG